MAEFLRRNGGQLADGLVDHVVLTAFAIGVGFALSLILTLAANTETATTRAATFLAFGIKLHSCKGQPALKLGQLFVYLVPIRSSNKCFTHPTATINKRFDQGALRQIQDQAIDPDLLSEGTCFRLVP